MFFAGEIFSAVTAGQQVTCSDVQAAMKFSFWKRAEEGQLSGYDPCRNSSNSAALSFAKSFSRKFWC